MRELSGKLSSTGLKIGLVVSRFNEAITDRLLRGALEIVERTGGSDDDVTVVRVPGSFEIPYAARQLARSGEFDAIVCLGALIQGETDHYRFLAAEVTRGILQVSLETGTPVTFGVITAENVEQAMNRAGVKSGNKGVEATVAAIEMAHVRRQLGVDRPRQKE